MEWHLTWRDISYDPALHEFNQLQLNSLLAITRLLRSNKHQQVHVGWTWKNYLFLHCHRLLRYRDHRGWSYDYLSSSWICLVPDLLSKVRHWKKTSWKAELQALQADFAPHTPHNAYSLPYPASYPHFFQNSRDGSRLRQEEKRKN